MALALFVLANSLPLPQTHMPLAVKSAGHIQIELVECGLVNSQGLSRSLVGHSLGCGWVLITGGATAVGVTSARGVSVADVTVSVVVLTG